MKTQATAWAQHKILGGVGDPKSIYLRIESNRGVWQARLAVNIYGLSLPTKMNESDPVIPECVDCLFHDEHEEATTKDPKSNEPLCGECYDARREWLIECQEQALHDWQPLYDDRGY